MAAMGDRTWSAASSVTAHISRVPSATGEEHQAPSPSTPPTTTSSKQEDAKNKLTDQTNLLPPARLIAVLCGVASCVLVTTLDSVVIATGLPLISQAFSAGSVIAWVPSAYFLASTAFMPLYGRLSDIFGRKAAMATGMTIFVLGALGSGFSRNIMELIICRAIAGAGGGGIISMAQIIISDVVTLRERGKFQGIIIAVNALGFAIGPPIGGALSEKVSWKWCFWINIPYSVIAITIITFILPFKPVQGNMKDKIKRIDYMGTFLTLAGSVMVLLPLTWGGVSYSWYSGPVLGPLIGGLAVIVLFCVWEAYGALLPIIPMYIFKHTTVVGVYIAMFANGFIFYSAMYYLPQFFQVGMGWSPIRSGVSLLPLLLAQAFSSWSTGLMVSWTGRFRALIYTGFTVWTIGSGCLMMLSSTINRPAMSFYMILSGFGAGLTMQTTTVAAQASVPRKDMSVVTAIRNFVRLLGGTLGLAIGSTFINNELRDSLTTLGLSPSTVSTIVDTPSLLSTNAAGLTAEQTSIALGGYTKGIRLLFAINTAWSAFALIATIFLIKHQNLTRGDDDQYKDKAVKQEQTDAEANPGSASISRAVTLAGSELEKEKVVEEKTIATADVSEVPSAVNGSAEEVVINEGSYVLNHNHDGDSDVASTHEHQQDVVDSLNGATGTARRD
ncbi:MFS general substrate transporter [Coniophora puteana RWD-64-598 SS2]|uniref:MFS general substrate transporter n=1 Tax=Coniophora puteana (strain RWD-64-598) TaxID=741705 RepID=A0A5M3MN13_CONPW|nr:MFS general substrate transporter [Coniophora puteana RWD-64-598 SS2]EIW80164.1 MFS general substrate transporter [Coniophora puteana RWD-64-598 SS2]